MIELVVASLIVFAITLTMTKASIFETKREFVRQRYEASFIAEERPNFIHTWFYKMWTSQNFWDFSRICPKIWYNMIGSGVMLCGN